MSLNSNHDSEVNHGGKTQDYQEKNSKEKSC
jgi:hypothetical protein